MFYALRPMMVRYQAPTGMLALNWAIQWGSDIAIYSLWGGKPLLYFLLSDFLAGSLHPCAAHFIAEHFVFVEGIETYSYYGPLNKLCFNVGCNDR